MSERGRQVTLRLPRLRVALGLLTAIALIAGAIVAGVRTANLASEKNRLAHQLSSFEVGALRAARDYATAFATYKYDEFGADVAATEAHSVDPFLSQYRAYTTQLQPSIVSAKAQSTANVLSAGLHSVSASSVVVDVFLDQTIVNTSGTHSQRQRVVMTMVRQHGKWLISQVRLL